MMLNHGWHCPLLETIPDQSESHHLFSTNKPSTNCWDFPTPGSFARGFQRVYPQVRVPQHFSKEWMIPFTEIHATNWGLPLNHGWLGINQSPVFWGIWSSLLNWQAKRLGATNNLMSHECLLSSHSLFALSWEASKKSTLYSSNETAWNCKIIKFDAYETVCRVTHGPQMVQLS